MTVRCDHYFCRCMRAHELNLMGPIPMNWARVSAAAAARVVARQRIGVIVVDGPRRQRTDQGVSIT
jgi:hypothetical protein